MAGADWSAISTGLIQLWLGGHPDEPDSLHRKPRSGSILAVCLLSRSAAQGAFYLALTIEPKYFAYAAGLFGLSTAWVSDDGGWRMPPSAKRAIERPP